MSSNEPLVKFSKLFFFRKLQPFEILESCGDSKKYFIKILTRGSMDITLNFNHVKSYSICFKTAGALGKLVDACQYFSCMDLLTGSVVFFVREMGG